MISQIAIRLKERVFKNNEYAEISAKSYRFNNSNHRFMTFVLFKSDEKHRLLPSYQHIIPKTERYKANQINQFCGRVL